LNDFPAIVVLDDDPTGTQTVHGVSVLTTWEVAELESVLRTERLFYLLTNSRALTARDSEALHRNLMRNLLAAARKTHRGVEIVSRSDSTLRGHYTLEPDVIREELALAGQPVDAELLIPFFGEGGRVTFNDVHHVVQDGRPVPVAETEFARDATFGFRSSNLRDWIEEKTGRRVRAADVGAVSLADIAAGSAAVADRLAAGAPSGRMIVNARNYADLKIAVAGIREASRRGRRFVFRTAASFVRVYGGIPERPLLTGAEIVDPAGAGGLVIVGSHVPKTTAQLECLLADHGCDAIEFNVSEVAAGRGDAEVARVRVLVEAALRARRTVVVFTSRRLWRAMAENSEHNLEPAVATSAALVELVRHLQTRPRFLIAKGGITSSDVATRGLGIRRAEVLGQILPGVPVWRQGPEARWPGGSLIVFPGNVGGADALRGVVAQFRSCEDPSESMERGIG